MRLNLLIGIFENVLFILRDEGFIYQDDVQSLTEELRKRLDAKWKKK